MTMTDPIADLLTRVRNANQAYHESVKIPASQMKVEIARILKEEGYIENYEVAQNNSHQVLNIKLRYGPDKMRALTGLKRISRPGLRVYAGKDEMPRVLGGLGTAIISTSKGVMTSRKAKEEGLGGEVVAYIW